MSDNRINVGRLLIEGMILSDQESRVTAKEKAGTFRGGSVGLLFEDGSTMEGCPRQALARYIGADPPRDPVQWAYDRLMLSSGMASEDLWADDLKRAIAATMPGFKLLREDELPIKWDVVSGDGSLTVPATGREDLILVDERGDVATLIELKQVSSLNTAASVLGGLKPKLAHVVQAANYAYRVGAPSQLWYVSRVNWSVPDWAFIKALFANPHPKIERFLKRGATSEKITTLLPFIVGFDLSWDKNEAGEERVFVQPLLHDGPLDSKAAGRGKEKSLLLETPVSLERIDRFYSACADQIVGKRLHPDRPLPMELNGKTHKGFSPCDYCDWKYNCDANESNYEAWVAEVKSNVAKG